MVHHEHVHQFTRCQLTLFYFKGLKMPKVSDLSSLLIFEPLKSFFTAEALSVQELSLLHSKCTERQNSALGTQDALPGLLMTETTALVIAFLAETLIVMWR
jgi:hypothetical protein